MASKDTMHLPKNPTLRNVRSLQRLQLFGLGINTDLQLLRLQTFTKVSTNFGSVRLTSVRAMVGISEHRLPAGFFKPTEEVSVQVYPQSFSHHPVRSCWWAGSTFPSSLCLRAACAASLLTEVSKKRWRLRGGTCSLLMLAFTSPATLGSAEKTEVLRSFRVSFLHQPGSGSQGTFSELSLARPRTSLTSSLIHTPRGGLSHKHFKAALK